MSKTIKQARHRLTKGKICRAIEEPCYGPYARLSRKKWVIVSRTEGYYSHDFTTGRGHRLPRVSLQCGQATFYNVAVRVKQGVEYVDLLDGSVRVLAKLS